ncbi:MAG: NAD(P)H-hydrate dehydratase [Armatimonadetes bacterium]|nr:NAD(P)H-hydrate dehydratase [Armatimonadota bacterium]
METDSKNNPTVLTPRALRAWPLPAADEGGDKESRGRVLIVGGSAETPGAVLLAAEAALRAGAGKLRLAVGRSLAPRLAVAVPEARVFGLPETADGEIAPEAAERVAELAGVVQSVVFGPGMIAEDNAARLMRDVLPRLAETAVVLDAAAMTCVKEDAAALHHLGGRVILTPHAGEMANILCVGKDEVGQDPVTTARRVAADLRATVALKGRETFIAAPDGVLYANRAGNNGLATSGSGDVLAGLIAGLAARGADAAQAAAWGVALHARAGDALARRVGALGYLARELAAEVPALLRALTAQPAARRRRSGGA